MKSQQALYIPKEDSHQILTMLAPSSQVTSLQNHEKSISVVYKSYGLQSFVIAA